MPVRRSIGAAAVALCGGRFAMDDDVPPSMDFRDTMCEIARLLAVFLGAVVLAHLGFLIATWLRIHGQG